MNRKHFFGLKTFEKLKTSMLINQLKRLTILKKPEHFEEHNLCQELEKCCTPSSSGDSDGSSSHSTDVEMFGGHW